MIIKMRENAKPHHIRLVTETIQDLGFTFRTCERDGRTTVEVLGHSSDPKKRVDPRLFMGIEGVDRATPHFVLW